MIKNKIFLTCMAVILSMQYCFAISLEDITEPLPPAYRLGVGSAPENKYKVSESNKVIKAKDATLDKQSEAIKNITYADLSLKKISKEISDDAVLE